MESTITDKQHQNLEAVREFCAQEVEPIRDQLEDDLTVRKKLYQKFASQGWFACNIPSDYGGRSLDGVSYALILSLVSEFDGGVGVAFSVSNWVSEAIYLFGTDEQKQQYLPPLANGERVGGCFALSEVSAGSDAKNIRTVAEPTANGYRLNGEKRWITNGNLADVCIVFAKVPAAKGHGITAFLVDRNTPGWSVSKIVDKMGLLTVNLTCLDFNNCEVPTNARLGEEGQGLSIALSMLDRGRIGIAAQAYGIASAAFKASVKHAKQREQFGHPIGAFEAIAFKLADMKVQLDAMHLLIMKAAALRDTGNRFTQEAAIAKLYATEACNQITAEAVQIHGGYGYVKDYPVERYYRDARITTIYEGTSEIQRIVIARHILGDIFEGT